MGDSKSSYAPLPRSEITIALNGSAHGADDVEALVALFLQNRAFDADAPIRGDRKDRLTKCAESLAATIADLEGVSFAFAGIDTYARLLADARWQRDVIERMLAEPMKKGKQADDRIWVINELANIWEHYTGNRATNTYDDGSEGFVGPFFDFVCLCFPNNVPFKTQSAIGSAIREALKVRDRSGSPHRRLRKRQSKRK